MGTNFYLKHKYLPCETCGHEKDHCDPTIHIGKRSGAGPYCYTCDQTLFTGPIDRLHFTDPEYSIADKCPVCKSKVDTFTCSFTWAMTRDYYESQIANFKDDEKVVIDENNEEYTKAEFEEVLKWCKIVFYQFGVWFS